jgi:hypothetical protein
MKAGDDGQSSSFLDSHACVRREWMFRAGSILFRFSNAGPTWTEVVDREGRRLKTFVAGNRGPDEALLPATSYGDLSGAEPDRRIAGSDVEEDFAGLSLDGSRSRSRLRSC